MLWRVKLSLWTLLLISTGVSKLSSKYKAEAIYSFVCPSIHQSAHPSVHLAIHPIFVECLRTAMYWE